MRFISLTIIFLLTSGSTWDRGVCAVVAAAAVSRKVSNLSNKFCGLSVPENEYG
jgi:hypothetical protein